MRRWSFYFCIIVFCISGVAQARKLDITKTHFAPYFEGNIGTSAVNRDAFDKAAGGAEFSTKVLYQWGGEYGFFLLFGRLGLRLGVEALYPQKMDAIEGQRGGTTQYNLTSNIIGILPVVKFEYSTILDAEKRLYFMGGIGSGTVTFQNNYTFTPAGRTRYSLNDFVEEGRAIAIMYEAGAGFEFSMVDNVTCFFDLGYRSLKPSDFKHQRSDDTFVGSVNKNDTVKNADGAKRKLNMDSTYIGVGLKFYFNF